MSIIPFQRRCAGTMSAAALLGFCIYEGGVEWDSSNEKYSFKD